MEAPKGLNYAGIVQAVVRFLPLERASQLIVSSDLNIPPELSSCLPKNLAPAELAKLLQYFYDQVKERMTSEGGYPICDGVPHTLEA